MSKHTPGNGQERICLECGGRNGQHIGNECQTGAKTAAECSGPRCVCGQPRLITEMYCAPCGEQRTGMLKRARDTVSREEYMSLARTNLDAQVKAGWLESDNKRLESELTSLRTQIEKLRSLAADVCLASGYESARLAVIALNTELMRLNQAEAAIAKAEGA